ncbi:MAG: hypothetical protein IAE78_18840 [Myxococcus sp.]|nr:hypothetical protein [Myxococcus sp.]
MRVSQVGPGLRVQGPGFDFFHPADGGTGTFRDLDARFGFAALSTGAGMLAFNGISWDPLDGPQNSQALAATVYSPAGLPVILTYWTTPPSGVGFFVAELLGANWGYDTSSPSGQANEVLGWSETVARPDGDGGCTVIVDGTSTPPRLGVAPNTTFSITAPALDGGFTNLKLASSENQRAVLSWRAQDKTNFWSPRCSAILPQTPDFALTSPLATDVMALATTGARHAAILGAATASRTLTVGDAGITAPAGTPILVVLGGGPTRFYGLGNEAQAPFGLAFRAVDGGHELNVMARCANRTTGMCAGLDTASDSRIRALNGL